MLGVVGTSILMGGCQTAKVILDGSAYDNGRPQVMVTNSDDPGPMNVRTSAFVGVFGKPGAGHMKVEFSSTDRVSVEGDGIKAMGTYVVSDDTAVATFQNTDSPDFDRALFRLTGDGKMLSFLGPGRQALVLKRTQ